MRAKNIRMLVRTGTSALAIGLLVGAGVVLAASIVLPTAAVAEGGQQQGNGNGGHGNGDGGHGNDGGKGAQTQGNGGTGQGGPGGGTVGPDAGEGEDDSDGRGPQYNKPDGDGGGGKPLWAQEGIPEVELGRLNVARSPDHVLNQAYAEAVKSLTTDMLEVYAMDLDDAIAYIRDHWDELTIIDSPLQNLALLKDALDGNSVINDYLTDDNDIWTLAAIFLGVASDKTMSISEDTVIAVTKILGFDLTGAQITQLAEDAEDVREAVLAGHG